MYPGLQSKSINRKTEEPIVKSIVYCPGVITSEKLPFFLKRSFAMKNVLKDSRKLYERIGKQKKLSDETVLLGAHVLDGTVPARRESVLMYSCLCGISIQETDELLTGYMFGKTSEVNPSDLIWRYIISESNHADTPLSLEKVREMLQKLRGELQNMFETERAEHLSFGNMSISEAIHERNVKLREFLLAAYERKRKGEERNPQAEPIENILKRAQTGYLSMNSLAATGIAMNFNREEMKEMFLMAGYENTDEICVWIMRMLI